MNKQRRSYQRIYKSYKKDLDFNKAVVHNTFALPTLTFIVEISDWTSKELDQLDIKNRKTSECQVLFIPRVMLIGDNFAEKMGQDDTEL